MDLSDTSLPSETLESTAIADCQTQMENMVKVANLCCVQILQRQSYNHQVAIWMKYLSKSIAYTLVFNKRTPKGSRLLQGFNQRS